MGTISVSLPSDGQTIDAADYNVPINTIVSEINGGLDSANIEAGGVVPNSLSSGTGTSWAWQSWTPTYTNMTIGNGTVNHVVYVQVGKTVHWAWKLTVGSTTSYSDPWLISFPVTPSSKFTQSITSVVGHGTFNDGGGSFYPLTCVYRTSGVSGINPLAHNASATYTTYFGVSPTIPVAPVSGDIIELSGTYEAA